MDGTVFCCDYDEYIRNRGKRRRIENVRKVISDRDIDYPWWLLDWIMYIVPVMQVGLCIICCVCSPCCKQRRRGFVYRIQQPSAIVNVQPYDPPPQGTMSVLPQSSASVHIPMPQATSSPLPLVHNSPYAHHSTIPPDHTTPFDEPPPPYSAVVGDLYSKQVS
ncbi:Protein of unknown function [Gryllus bimaculatus]|nr:Protein of unknown function [Gryllus bimaculatus]